MAEFEVFFKNESSDYGDGFVLNKYGDRYSLVSAREAKSGTVYKDWCFPQDKDKKPREKSVPMGVRLGTYTETVEALNRVLQVLQNPNSKPATTPASAASVMGGTVVDDDGSIPF